MLNLETRESKIKLVQDWIEALRSGEYKQGTGALCQVRGTKEEYCCLGVLCEVAGLPYEVSDSEVSYPALKDYGAGVDTSTAILPLVLASPLKDILKSDFGDTGLLMGMNDNEGKSFNEIADFIEKHMLKPYIQYGGFSYDENVD